MRTLRNAIELGQLRQAYLFAGPRGTGKTSMARILAKALNCENGPTATPDKVCHACVSIASGTSLDVVEMDAASQRGIDDIREIRDRVILQPAEGRYKVYILDEAHQLTDAAWNALLKLIEEPPPTSSSSSARPTWRRCCKRSAPAPDLRLRPAAAARARPGAPSDRRRREDRSARRRARADRARRAWLVPGRRLDSRPARLGDREHDRRPVRAAAPRRRRGGRSLPPLRHDRRPRHRGRARSWRSSPSRARTSAGSSPTCSSTCATCCSSSTWATCPTRFPSPTRRESGCASRRTSCPRRRCCGSATCSRSPSRTRARARPAAAARAGAGEGHEPGWTSPASRWRSGSSSSSNGSPARRSRPPPPRRRRRSPGNRLSSRLLSRPSPHPRPLPSRRRRWVSTSSRTPGCEPSCPPSSPARSPSRLCSAKPGRPRSRRDADARVPFQRRLPPAPGGGAEERQRHPRGALRGHGPPPGRTLALGEGEDAVEEEDEALTEEALISMMKDTFDAHEVEDTPQ